ncbi:hypothetical protein E2562_029509 [Oryza meyeriana var. granulata]|uniref:Uncharacterized protein n=1 Tax=Oryza meyeriana var. granulata TaxID=110450 RepID=A0A6G1FDV6_9ORYZ|nr:hypothetical protein E2562_029509 [Oryza meyeriana var. granulata]
MTSSPKFPNLQSGSHIADRRAPRTPSPIASRARSGSPSCVVCLSGAGAGCLVVVVGSTARSLYIDSCIVLEIPRSASCSSLVQLTTSLSIAGIKICPKHVTGYQAAPCTAWNFRGLCEEQSLVALQRWQSPINKL